MPPALRAFACFAFLFVFPLSASVARAGGSHGDFERTVTVDDQEGVVAIGEPWLVTVSDALIGTPVCSEGGSCNGPSCFTPVEPNPSSVEGLSCEGVDCTAHVEPGFVAPGARASAFSFSIAVVARTAGTAHVTFDLRDRKDDVRHVDINVRFADVARIAVTRELDDAPHGTVYAALPKTSYRWCAELEDAEGSSLRFRRERLTLEARGLVSQITTSNCFQFTVERAGEVTTTFRYGAFRRTDRVRVVDAEEVAGIEIVDVDRIAPGVKNPIDEDPLRRIPSATSLNVRGCQQPQQEKRVLVRALLRDGASALLPGSALRIEPQGLATFVRHSAGDTQPIRRILAGMEGRGRLEASSGSVETSAELVVRGSCLEALPEPTTDAGTDGDARVDAEADVDGGADASSD